jgi:hypothetical protein
MSGIPVEVVLRAVRSVIENAPYPARGWYPTTSSTMPDSEGVAHARKTLLESCP